MKKPTESIETSSQNEKKWACGIGAGGTEEEGDVTKAVDRKLAEELGVGVGLIVRLGGAARFRKLTPEMQRYLLKGGDGTSQTRTISRKGFLGV